jgi:hypothetical protein
MPEVAADTAEAAQLALAIAANDRPLREARNTIRQLQVTDKSALPSVMRLAELEHLQARRRMMMGWKLREKTRLK